MHKTVFKYRLYPTSQQAATMQKILGECRWLYNHFLEQRKTAWEERQESFGLYDQIKMLPGLKQERSSLNTVHSQVLQNVAVRIDLAFKAFFRRVKSGEKPGYPRFRGAGWYDSFTFPQVGYVLKDNAVYLAKVGDVKGKIHRPAVGKFKTCCVKRTSTGKWFVSFTCEVEEQLLSESKEAVGIDVGLTSFAAFSNGETPIPPPRFFRTDEKALARAQRRLSKEAKGTPARRKRRKVVAHIHERIANRRSDFAHQHSRRIVNRYGIIVVEDLNINRMLHNHCLAKSIADAAWGQFTAFLAFKAENAGRKFVAVNPAYTTQDCSRCGHRQPMPLSEREFRCPCCGLVLNRDHNASLNILARGLASLGLAQEAPDFSRGE